MVPTKDIITRKVSFGDLSCAVCGDEVESLRTFKDYSGVYALTFASRWGCALDNRRVSSFEEVIAFCNLGGSVCFRRMFKDFFTVFLSTLLYCC